jgi:hypothetical protein
LRVCSEPQLSDAFAAADRHAIYCLIARKALLRVGRAVQS